MAKQIQNKEGTKVISKQQVQRKGKFPQNVTDVTIPYPMLWLALAAILLYIQSIGFDFTELDDSIFIREFQDYNEDVRNIFKSFKRGLFNPTKDPYYRPIFMDSIIFNYQLSGINLAGYHFFNILFHAGSVLLFYRLLSLMRMRGLHAFILSMLFAIHPVLSQAVAWIPGRNDTMLALFVISFFIHCIRYQEGKLASLGWAALFLLLAFFTKESAVFAAPAAFVILVIYMDYDWKGKNSLALYGTWIACFAIWYVARAGATTDSGYVTTGALISGFFGRLPLLLQYLGKIFLPFNLSVFPTQEDTVIYWGIAALAILIGGLLTAGNVHWRRVAAGLIIFFLFLLPALMVPASLNMQAFEHRLYLPILGILIILPETILFKKQSDGGVLLAVAIIGILLAGANLSHQSHFANREKFWSQAVETSPNSAYANMMLAARIDNREKSYQLFYKAYRINPKEKYINYYLGEMLQMRDSVQASEPYLLAEKKVSNYYKCDLLLARVYIERGDFKSGIEFLKTYLDVATTDQMANNNLLKLYMDTRMFDDARKQAARMQQMGMPVPADYVRALNNTPAMTAPTITTTPPPAPQGGR